MRKLTAEEYSRLQLAYDYFNDELFNGELPQVLITFQRQRRMMGYFSGKRFVARNGAKDRVDEIALNPSNFEDGDDIEILQTLVHEMCHGWQYHFGAPSRSGYHNKEWAAKMVEVGLIPSDTGRPGGKMTGQSMSDYPSDTGRFIELANRLIASDWTLNYRSFEPSPPHRSANGGQGGGQSNKLKVKYTCDTCEANVWGKPDLNIFCGDCMRPMSAQ